MMRVINFYLHVINSNFVNYDMKLSRLDSAVIIIKVVLLHKRTHLSRPRRHNFHI